MIDQKLLKGIVSTIMVIGFMVISSYTFSQETKITIKNGTLKVKQGESEFEMGGEIMWDYDYFETAYTDGDQEDDQGGGDSELRRACLSLKNSINRSWKAELKISFNNEDSTVEIDDAYLTFTGFDFMELTIGQNKEPFGLEELTGSQDITFIERSMSTCAFTPGRGKGFRLSSGLKRFTWDMGVYETEDGKDQKNTYALTGRLTFAPAWHHQKDLLHVGVAGSMRDFNGGKYQIKERAEVHTSEEIVKSLEISADTVSLLGLEAALVLGSFSLQAEHMNAYIKADDGDNIGYGGYYVFVSYFLTGESRDYNRGTFSGPKLDDYLNGLEYYSGRRSLEREGKGNYGALELTARYGVLNAEDKRGGVRAANLTLGFNYYINKQVRFMTNYITTALEGDILYKEDKAKAISFRMQYVF